MTSTGSDTGTGIGIGAVAASDPLLQIPADLRIPSFNQAAIPAAVRDGGTNAQQAYVEGLAFEQVLVNELSSRLAGPLAAGGGQSGLAAGGQSLTGAAPGDPALGGGGAGGAYASLIPQALSSSIMADGGLGIAGEIAGALDPALDGAGAPGLAGTPTGDPRGEPRAPSGTRPTGGGAL